MASVGPTGIINERNLGQGSQPLMISVGSVSELRPGLWTQPLTPWQLQCIQELVATGCNGECHGPNLRLCVGAEFSFLQPHQIHGQGGRKCPRTFKGIGMRVMREVVNRKKMGLVRSSRGTEARPYLTPLATVVSQPRQGPVGPFAGTDDHLPLCRMLSNTSLVNGTFRSQSEDGTPVFIPRPETEVGVPAGPDRMG